MGGVVSAGSTNTELVNNLVHADILKTPEIEQAFRAVDRGVYYLPEYRESAYKDRAWKHEHLHLSAPCIYGEVMEALELKTGLSFLNLGSGTGYLSTMAGLILGAYGINHGVEFYEDVVNYSETHLKTFISVNEFFDAFEFCPPIFHCGNCLNLSAGTMKYDRVYCGAACPPENEEYMKSLVKVGGLLVMPLRDELIKAKRVSETRWEVNAIMAVSFADLNISACDRNFPLELSKPSVLSLQEICRVIIRRVLRKNIEYENPDTKLFALHCNKKKGKRQKNDFQKSFDNDDIYGFSPSNANQYPFIRVSFLPSGGRFMFIRGLSDNEEEEEDNMSGFGAEGDSESHQHSDDAINDDFHENIESDNEGVPDLAAESARPQIPNHSNSSGTSKQDSPITDKINAFSLGRSQQSLVNGIEIFDNYANGSDKKHCQEGLKRDNASVEYKEDSDNQLEHKMQTFKKQKMSKEVDNYFDGKTSALDSFSSFQSIEGENRSQETSKCCTEDTCSLKKDTFNENEDVIEKSKAIPGPSCDGDISNLMSTSSGIGMHESEEIDDITGFDQQDLQTNSSLSISSQSSPSLSSPSRSINQINRHNLNPTSTSNEDNRALGKDGEVNDEGDSIHQEVEHLDYRKHMKDKVSSLHIPIMLKKFLLYDRV